jgi:hypothetical protein
MRRARGRRVVSLGVLSVMSMLAAASVRAQGTLPGGAVPMPAGVRPVRPVTADSMRVPIPDSLKSPLSPRRAFLTSLLIPGAAQSRLKRPTASIIFAAAEVISLGMARKAAQDMREAERAARDSVVSGYTVDPTTGVVSITGYIQSRFTPARVRARHTHYEDWLAAIAFNHIISATDAYVAAHLWDFKANVSMNPSTRTTTVAASISF